ncbi:hypothetical protein EES47_24920 [Streptomyces sp. ADI98-12]|nr:hypothetical protein EES47_24920 [Streptomyces sp. ADI98-12]
MEVTAHAEPLGALPGEQEGGTTVPGHAFHDVGVGRAGGQRAERGQRRLQVGARDHRAVVEEGALRGQGQRHVPYVRRRVGEEVGQAGGLGAQCLLGTARQDPRLDTGRCRRAARLFRT